MPDRPWTVIGVPIDSVGRAGGTEHAPAALREAGLVHALGARDAGDLPVRIRGEVRDPRTGIVGSADVLALTALVADAVGSVLTSGARPLVLGGCCALVPGALAGARDAGRGAVVGVAYVDGHVDVYDGPVSPTGEAADMPLGVALGTGPPAWVAAAGGPSAEPGTTFVLGARDPQERLDVAPLLFGPLSAMGVLDPAQLRGVGMALSGTTTEVALAGHDSHFWLHLDVDVLDEAEMPATDYLMPGGLTWDELEELVAPLGSSTGLLGVSLGCLNPDKDPGGRLTRRTADLLAGVLGR